MEKIDIKQINKEMSLWLQIVITGIKIRVF